MALTLYRDVQRPLTPDEIDANFEYGAGIAQDIRDQGLQTELLQRIDTDGDAGTITLVTSANRSFGPISLPARQFRTKGTYQVGTAYLQDDIVELNGSQYRATQAFTAVNFTAEQTAGKLITWLSKGADTYNFKGLFSATVDYKAKDAVIVVGTYGTKNLGRLYTVLIDTPAGGAGPGSAVANNWFLLATQVAFTTDVFDTTEAKFMSDVVADYKARIAKLESAMTNVLGRVAALDGKSYPFP